MTYGITLTEYFGVNDDHIGIFIFFFAAGNGCIVLGRCFDIIGRRKMIFFYIFFELSFVIYSVYALYFQDNKWTLFYVHFLFCSFLFRFGWS